MEERKEALRLMKICRFCFSNDENELSDIYQKEPKTVPLPIQIMSCVSIEVFSNDGLPQLICNSCKCQTNRSYIFRSNCRKAEDALKNFLQTGELIKPDIEKPLPQQKPAEVPPAKGTPQVPPKPAEDTSNVKKMKLDDGTEVITLCISQSDDTPTQDDSQHAEASSSKGQESEEEGLEELPESESSPKAGEMGTKIFSCEYCEKSFLLEQLLELHVTNYHRERQFTCFQCESKFFSKYDLRKHLQTHQHLKPFECSVCNKTFGREGLLRRHEKVHTSTPKYMCAECEKVFVLKTDLEFHMKKHEKSRPFSCETCDKSFVFKQGLERHMNSVHSDDKPHKCNYCEASFSTPIRLTRHITMHAGLRPYPCKICSRTFLLSHHLTRHMRSHYVSQPEEAVGKHKCDICSMSFRRKDSLINHSAIHSMVNLRCVICNTSFENAKMVKDHITTHLQGLAFPCEKCDYSFDTEKQLVEHQVKHAEMEYEEQIEKEVISEGALKYRAESIDESAGGDFLQDEEAEDAECEISNFHLPNLNDPRTVELSPQQPTKARLSEINREGMVQLFKTEAFEDEEETDHEGDDEEEQAQGDSGIKPIYRSEGTKMYQRKGPIKRKIPQVQTPRTETAALEEINERPSMLSVNPAALSNFPAKKPVNVKVGDKVVKVQKFIISKDEMKHMAKLGILEVKNGQVIMKTPGQPILNATIKPVQQSDIENLINNQKSHHSKPQIKQYERKATTSQAPVKETTVQNIIDDFN